MNYKEIIFNELELIKNELIQNYDAKGMRASGNFANSLKTNLTTNGAQLIGANYSKELEEGKQAGDLVSVNVIEKWIQDKNIQFSNITINSLAYLIVKKIKREGWKRERFGGVELISQTITPQRIQKIIDKVGDLELSGFIAQIRTNLNELQ
jgi:hypothetical protein